MPFASSRQSLAKRACRHIYHTRALIIGGTRMRRALGEVPRRLVACSLREQRMTEVAEFAIEYTSSSSTPRVGRGVGWPEFAQDKAALIPLYRAMVLTRRRQGGRPATHRSPGDLRLVARPGRRWWSAWRARCVRKTCCCRPIARPARSSTAASVSTSCSCTGAATSAAATSPAPGTTSR